VKASRDSERLWQAGLLLGGIGLIAATLHLYPAFEVSDNKPRYSPAAADRQIEAAKSHLEGHPDDMNSYVALAMGYYQKGPDHYVEAMNALDKARDLGATSEHLFYYAGVMYDALGLPDYAVNELSKYLRHRPNDYETMIRLGNLYFRQKKVDEALAMYKEALHAWPQDATAWFNYAIINKEKGNYPVALTSLDQVKKIAGRLPEGGSFEEGEIYRLSGDNARAFQSYQQELSIHPAFIAALEASEAMIRAKGDLKQARNMQKRIRELKKQAAAAKTIS
jgi:tetratricopeptide (TPR) repeat protein